MDDDFNSPQAVSIIFEFVNTSNKFLEDNSNPNKKLIGYSLFVLTKLGNVLTLFQKDPNSEKKIDNPKLFKNVKNVAKKYQISTKGKYIEHLINSLLELREKARKVFEEIL